MYRWNDLRRPDIVAFFRHQIKQAFHVTDREILIFGGCQNKPWPRKDIDALLILENDLLLDSFSEGEFEKLIWEVGESVWLRTNRKVGGDLWVYLPLRGELWHKGYHLDGYAKEIFGIDPFLGGVILYQNRETLKSRNIYPFS
ncbi:hypothetical protein LCGC14_2763610 [marine sediment metagenome]|uniref:Uncharacterized protein n=1 Tax=marine sediment metagenome TaxID=412755 RepID=A0A0F8ZK71_9ZZZZ